MKTVIAHFYNEEFLLPWWLEYHSKIFDHGILIDYDSTDRSVEIIKEICPTWEVVPSRNKYFDHDIIDVEVNDIQQKVKYGYGWCAVLNITEFLLGDFDKLFGNYEHDVKYVVPTVKLFDWNPTGQIDRTKPLWEQFHYGIFGVVSAGRMVHNHYVKLGHGRHYDPNCDLGIILHYSSCISSPEMLARRLQIQHRQSEKERNLGPNRAGFQHNNHGQGFDEGSLNYYHAWHSEMFNFVDCRPYYQHFIQNT